MTDDIHPLVRPTPETRRYLARRQSELSSHVIECDKPITDCWPCSTYFKITPT